MERVHAVMLAVLIAAVALFGLSYVVDGGSGASTPSSDATGLIGPDGRLVRRVGLWGSERETHRRGMPPGRGGEPRRGRSGTDRGGIGGSDESDLLPGASRPSRSTRETGGGSITSGDMIARLPDDLLAARTGAVPRGSAAASGGGGGGGSSGSGRHVFEFVDERGRDRGGGADVLLSIPFRGDVETEKGGEPTQVDGLVFDGNEVEFTEEAQLVFLADGHVNGRAGTISFEIEPNWAGGDDTNNALVTIRTEHQWENNLLIVKNYDSLRFIIVDRRGIETNVNASIADWAPQQPRQVTATWDGDGMALYVDRQLVGESALSSRPVFSDTTPIHIGSDFPGSSYRGAQAKISDLKLYGRALGADEIR